MPDPDSLASSIVDTRLCPERGQTVVILHDSTKAELAAAITAGLAARGCVPAPLPVSDEMLDLDAIVQPLFARDDVALVALISPRMWLDLGLSRHAAMVDGKPTLLAKCRPVFADWLLPIDSLARVIGSDVAADADYLRSLLKTLPPQAPIHLTTPGGTDLQFLSRDWRLCEWTEVLTSPIEASISGRVVADASVFFARVAQPIALTIDAGRIVAIECGDAADPTFATYVDWMRRELERDDKRWQLAEVGIGGCAGARLCGIIMEDEAVRGTCHFCFGDNARYGGANACDWHGGTVVAVRPCLTWSGGAWHSDAEPGVA